MKQVNGEEWHDAASAPAGSDEPGRTEADTGGLENSLGIFIITFNRAEKLDRTLTQLAASPFAGCAITVLDNHSTDDTPAVVARHSRQFARLHSVRHRVNVGLSANYLRAVELATHPYTWVIGDDDNIVAGGIDDTLREITAGAHDLIIVGAVNQPEWALGESTSARALWRRGFPYFYVTGWITGVIFRTSLFDSDSFHFGYKNADNVFPHYPFFARCLEQDVSVYLAREWIAGSREPEGYGRLGSEMIAGWVNSSRFIADSGIRREAMLHGPFGQGRRATRLAATALLFKVFAVHNLVRRDTLLTTWCRGFGVAPWDLRLAMVPALLHMAVPPAAARGVWGVLQRLRGRPYRGPEEYSAALDEART